MSWYLKKVLNAGAVEFGAAWGNFCEQCISKSTNPYITGKEGNYRPLRSFLYLTERTQSDYNRNTNIRKDGTYVSFSPFWVKNGGKDWKTQKSDWTFASEVTMFSPYGFEMENRDALGRYTAADYGYNNTLPICISGNAQYQEIGFTGFEDANMNDCKETHFIFNDNLGNVSDKHAHTGSYSIQVKKKEKVELEKILVPCGE